MKARLLLEQLEKEEAKQLFDYGVATNQVDMVRRALDSGHIRTDGMMFKDRLVTAIRNGSLDVLKLIFTEYGVDINLKDYDAWSLLRHAFFYGNIESAKFLLERGADVNDGKNEAGNSLLYSASYNGRPEFVKLFLEYGAEVNAKNNLGWTALDVASPEIKNLLIQHGGVLSDES